MQSKGMEPLRTKMESLRMICDREVPVELQKMDSFTASHIKHLDSIKDKVEETVQNQGKLWKMKTSLREAEDEFVKVLAVKTRKEAKQMATRDSISATRARLEQLKRTVEVQRAKRDEYAAIMSQQSLALVTSVEKGNENSECKEEIQEAILWYNKVLGFQIEGGQGVKFTFNNINMKNPDEEYFFTIRYENDTYTLLACDPHLDETKELIHELNRTNGLFKFVRTMREKFQEATSRGLLPQPTAFHQELSTISVSVSAPVLSVSTDGSETPVKNVEHQYEEDKRRSKKANRGRNTEKVLMSPSSELSRRRSPRLKAKK